MASVACTYVAWQFPARNLGLQSHFLRPKLVVRLLQLRHIGYLLAISRWAMSNQKFLFSKFKRATEPRCRHYTCILVPVRGLGTTLAASRVRLKHPSLFWKSENLLQPHKLMFLLALSTFACVCIWFACLISVSSNPSSALCCRCPWCPATAEKEAPIEISQRSQETSTSSQMTVLTE